MTKADFIKTLQDTLVQYATACHAIADMAKIAEDFCGNTEDAFYSKASEDITDTDNEELAIVQHIAYYAKRMKTAISDYAISDAYGEVGDYTEAYANL